MRVLLALTFLATVSTSNMANAYTSQFNLVGDLLTCLGTCGTVSTLGAIQYCNTVTVGAWHNADGSNCAGIENWGTSQVTDFRSIFYHAQNFNQDISSWDTSSVTNMYGTFTDTLSFNQDLSTWDTSKVTSMHSMFWYSSFNGDISTWDTSKVTTMSQMFARSLFNRDVSEWDVSSVTNFGYIFGANSAWTAGYENTFNGDVSKWKFGQGVELSSMFWNNPYFNRDISEWDISGVTGMNGLFRDATAFNQDISGWDMRGVTGVYGIFKGNTAFNQDLSAWEFASGVSTVYYNSIFDGTTSMTQELDGAYWVGRGVGADWYSGVTVASSANTCPYNLCLNDPHNTGGTCSDGVCTCPSHTRGDRCWFGFCPAGTQKVGQACVECPTDEMSAYDSPCGASCPANYVQDAQNDKKCVFTPADVAALKAAVDACIVEDATGACTSYDPIGLWDVSNAEIYEMFRDKTQFNQDISDWDTSQATIFKHTFREATAFNGDLSTWDVSQVHSMGWMFWGASAFNQDISAWDVGKVTGMRDMFREASSFNQDLSAWDVRKVTNMYTMFLSASSFNQVLCGQYWVDSTAVQTYMFGSSSGLIATSACDCPYNLCLNQTHSTGGTCSAGVCTCTVKPWEGDRCGDQCPDNTYNHPVCDQCWPGYTRFKSVCRPDTQTVTQFLDTVKGSKVGAERSKAVRAKFRPQRDDTKTEAEMMVQLPVVKADLEPKMKELVEEMEATLGTVELEISIAAEVTSSSTNIDDCHFDLSTQEPGKKTVLHAFDVDNYVFMCDSTSGTNTFVARAQEKTDGSEVSCWDATASGGSGNWAAATTVAAGASHTCNGVPLLIGSLVPACGGGTGCCSNAECENGDCINNKCVCEAGFEGETCAQPTECKDITTFDTYQKKGCCDC